MPDDLTPQTPDQNGVSNRNETLAAAFNEHRDELWQFLAKLVPDIDQREDVLSETFLKLITKWDRYDPARGTVGALLFTIARTTALDFLRERKSRRALPLEGDIAADFGEKLLERLYAKEVVEQLKHDLTPADREYLEEHLKHGDNKLAAENLDVSEGRIRHRAASVNRQGILTGIRLTAPAELQPFLMAVMNFDKEPTCEHLDQLLATSENLDQVVITRPMPVSDAVLQSALSGFRVHATVTEFQFFDAWFKGVREVQGKKEYPLNLDDPPVMGVHQLGLLYLAARRVQAFRRLTGSVPAEVRDYWLIADEREFDLHLTACEAIELCDAGWDRSALDTSSFSRRLRGPNLCDLAIAWCKECKVEGAPERGLKFLDAAPDSLFPDVE